MALTDGLLSQAGWRELPGSLSSTAPPASFVSTPGAKGAVVLRHLSRKKQPLSEDESEKEPVAAFPLRWL